MSELDEKQESRPTSATSGQGGAVARLSREKKPKAPRPSTGRPRGRPTTGLLTVACTKCGALVSFMCRTASGKILAAGHEERRALAGLAPRKKWKPADAEPKSDAP